MFYFSFIFFTMVYSVEQNTFIVVFYFQNGRFNNGELSVKMNSIKISEQHCEQIFNNQNN
jgi:hypothetical protein